MGNCIRRSKTRNSTYKKGHYGTCVTDGAINNHDQNHHHQQQGEHHADQGSYF